MLKSTARCILGLLVFVSTAGWRCTGDGDVDSKTSEVSSDSTTGPDSQDPPSSDQSDAEQTEPTQSAGCRRFNFNEGGTQISWSEQPQQEGDGDGSMLERRVSIDARQEYEGFVDKWNVVVSGTTDRGSRLDVSFLLKKDWEVATRPGHTVTLRSTRESVDCTATNSEGSVEQMLLAQDTIRDAQGNLLLLSALDMPLDALGSAVMKSELVPELRVRWAAVGCPPFSGDEVIQPEDEQRGSVGIEVVSPDEAQQLVVRPGGRGTILLGEHRYVLAVEKAWMPLTGDGCGRSRWALYREGYLSSTAGVD